MTVTRDDLIPLFRDAASVNMTEEAVERQAKRFADAMISMFDVRRVSAAPQKPDLSTVEKRNAFYNSDEYRNMTTAEKCGVQGDGFINDYD